MSVLNTIRDPHWRTQIEAKLAEIKAVREQHAYLGYMRNWHLFDQLETLKGEHQAVFEASYHIPLQRNAHLKAQLESQPDIHPLRLGKARKLIKEIESKLAAEDYQSNAEAVPLLDELEKHLNLAQNEFHHWEKQLTDWRMRLKELMLQVWAEDYKELKGDYQNQKQLIQENSFPRQPLAPQEAQVKVAIERRTQDWDKLQKALRLHPRLKKQSQQWHNHYLPREQFLSESKKLRRKAVIRTSLTTLGIALLASLLGGLGYFVPRWQAAKNDLTAWQNAKAQNTVLAYETYIQAFPAGAKIDSAQSLLLALPEGILSQQLSRDSVAFRYEGALTQAQADGYGIAEYADASRYEGYWQMGLRDSLGTLTFADGASYQGHWQADQRSGKGKMTYANGDVYEGNWAADDYQGWGAFIGKDGSEYRGGWQAGKPQGKGVYQYVDGSSYDGYWQEGYYQGTGRYTQAEGTSYMGQWQQNKRQGEGQISWANGGRFTGVWLSDTINGQGVFVNRFREQLSGRWQGTPEAISLYDGAGNLIKQGRWEGGLFLD
ncbi:MAG: hypothetical protein AAFN10_03600 [Bacteroidota bacterium]